MSNETTRIKMNHTRTIDRPGGATETYAAGCEYNVSPKKALILSADRGANPVVALETETAPEPKTIDPSPPPPVLDVVDNDTETEPEE